MTSTLFRNSTFYYFCLPLTPKKPNIEFLNNHDVIFCVKQWSKWGLLKKDDLYANILSKGRLDQRTINEQTNDYMNLLCKQWRKSSQDNLRTNNLFNFSFTVYNKLGKYLVKKRPRLHCACQRVFWGKILP